MRVSRKALRNAEALVDRWWVDGENVVHWWTRRLRNLAPDVDLSARRLPGRPRALSVRTLLVGWVLVAGTVTGDDKMLVNRVHTKLLNLFPASQRRLGITWTGADGTSQQLTLRQVHYLWRNMVRVVDGSPNFGAKDLEPDARTERDEALQRLVDGLMAATMPGDLEHAGSYSVDSTYLPTWAKPYWRATPPRGGWATPASAADDTAAGDGDGDGAGDGADGVELVETEDGTLIDPATGEVLDPSEAGLDRDVLPEPEDPELAEALDAMAADDEADGLDLTDDEEADGVDVEDDDDDDDEADDAALLDAGDVLAEGLRHAERREQVRRGILDSDGTFRGVTPAQRAAMTHDPDARHRFMASRSKKTGRLNVKTDVFGYQITIAVRVREDDGPAVPALCERVVVKPANHGEAEAAVELLERLNAQGQALSDVVADRGFTFRRPDSFHLPIRRMGGQLVMDLHPLQRGLRGTYRGALLVDGGLFSPGLPSQFVNLAQPQPADSRAEVEAKLAQFEWRQAWALKSIGGGLTQRVTCPAAGAARIICELKKSSKSLDPATHQKVYPDPSFASLPVCQQTSMQLPLELDAWRRQKHPFGTLAWYESFKPRRNAVEGFFGNLKTPGTEHLHRGTTRSFGLAANTLLVALLAAATNVRLLQTFKADHGSKASETDVFLVGEHDTAPQYRSARRSRPATSIRALRQRGAAIRRGPQPPGGRSLALVGPGGGGPGSSSPPASASP